MGQGGLLELVAIAVGATEPIDKGGERMGEQLGPEGVGRTWPKLK